MTQMQLIFLGTGGSWPTVKRNVTSVALKRGREIILFDCGEGTQRQFQKSQLSYMQISKILITHFHGDHFLGLPGLIQTMQLNDRKSTLHIYGPRGIDVLLSQLLSLGYFKPSYRIITHEVTGGDCIEFPEYTLDVLDVSHGIPAVAYRIKERLRPGKFNKPKALALGIPEGPLFSQLQKGNPVTLNDKRIITPEEILGPPRPGRTVVFSGDTKPLEEMISFADHADILIHEGTFDASMEETAEAYGHSTVSHAALIAQKAHVGRLFITHISPRYLDYKELLKEALDIFPNAFIPKDFVVITVGLKK